MSTASTRSVVIHGHFYQPPREDAWLDVVVRQPSAAPDHDWNARIARECYGPVTQARLTTSEGGQTVNTLEFISFNFGPTLLRWMETEASDIYARILEADQRSLARLGHGNAIAQAFHHTILPLATLREKRIEVRWGIADFERRYGRRPEGLWLPETAVDHETLDVLGDEGITFVVVAPHQVDPVPVDGTAGWIETAGGSRIALVPYDGTLSHDVAYGDATRDGEAWAVQLATATLPHAGDTARRLVSLATDGETYGHHKEFAELGLAAALYHLGRRNDVVVENFASFLAAHAPEVEVSLLSPSSWSCAHGVQRWQAECGCKLDPGAPTQQAWREPLREGLGRLATALHIVFEERMPAWLGDPWVALMAYGDCLHLNDPRAIVAKLATEASIETPELTPDGAQAIVSLLEMERNALRMFTSCAWFFDDVARVEPRQVLEYAERAIELSGDPQRFRPLLLDSLRRARSNDPKWTDAAHFFEERVLRERGVSDPATSAAASPSNPR